MDDTLQVGGLTVITIETPSLGDRSYLVHDGVVALAVDPQRDVDRVLDTLAELGVRLTHVFETHIHNDYVTGGLALSDATGADYLLNADDPVAFRRTPVRDGDIVDIGDRMRVTALATPGHTFTHLSYVLRDAAEPGAVAVFTGGSLLFGTTGRPDLLGPEHTDRLARLQHSSARRLADELTDGARVLPTHGFGSFCSSTQTLVTESTIGQERLANPVLSQDQQAYVDQLLAGLDAFPAYYARMAPMNLTGPRRPDLSPPESVGRDELRRRIAAGEWVVDLRQRLAYAAGHVPGALNFGLDGGFATYVGWLIDWGTPITLLGSTASDVAVAQRELVRIGIERPSGAASGDPRGWATKLTSFPVASFADLAEVRHHRQVSVLDVRRGTEHRTAHLLGAVHIPIHELPKRLSDVPAGEVWVHCQGGYRASVAASFLDAAGRQVVAIDDDFDEAGDRGLELVTTR
jgi:glyoxylase-like metal-dependent hydrolase (beta-lactamase superfamily II)/rhodanese-related sulfurtransferase